MLKNSYRIISPGLFQYIGASELAPVRLRQTAGVNNILAPITYKIANLYMHFIYILIYRGGDGFLGANRMAQARERRSCTPLLCAKIVGFYIRFIYNLIYVKDNGTVLFAALAQVCASSRKRKLAQSRRPLRLRLFFFLYIRFIYNFIYKRDNGNFGANTLAPIRDRQNGKQPFPLRQI